MALANCKVIMCGVIGVYTRNWRWHIIPITHRLQERQPHSGSRIVGTIGQGPAKLLL